MTQESLSTEKELQDELSSIMEKAEELMAALTRLDRLKDEREREIRAEMGR